MPKPVCVPCGRFFRPNKTGRTWTEMKPNGGVLAPPGNEAPSMWSFYKVWQGDEWICHGCGALIIVGHGSNPWVVDYEPDAIEKQIAFEADKIIVNDC